MYFLWKQWHVFHCYIQLYELLYWGFNITTPLQQTPIGIRKKKPTTNPTNKKTTHLLRWPTDHPPNPKGAAPLALLFDLLALDSRLRHHRRALTPQEKAEVVRSVAGEVQRGSETAPSAAPWCPWGAAGGLGDGGVTYDFLKWRLFKRISWLWRQKNTNIKMVGEATLQI